VPVNGVLGGNIGSVFLLSVHSGWSTVFGRSRDAWRSVCASLHVSTVSVLHGLAQGVHGHILDDLIYLLS